MELSIYQIDAFANRCFEGNPAAVCPLDNWFSDELLQNIAEENNLSETAFFVKGDNEYYIRWFTPVVEVDLCGHATLASAHVIFDILGYDGSEIAFRSRSGVLTVSRYNGWLVMDFPATSPKVCDEPGEVIGAFDRTPIEVLRSDDYMVVFESEQDIVSLAPDFNALERLDCRGIIVTSKGEYSDFVSRFFAPRCGIKEDPVTGSAHCTLTPYWAKRLNKNKLTARQLSKRGGQLKCELIGDRVLLSGKAVRYSEGTFHI